MNSFDAEAQIIEGAARFWTDRPDLTARAALWEYVRGQGLRRAYYATLPDYSRRRLVQKVVARWKELRGNEPLISFNSPGVRHGEA